MQRCLNVSAHTRTQRAHSACAVLQEQGSSLILVKTSEAEQRKAELSVPLATPHQQSVHCLLYVRARRFIPNKRSVSWTKTQYSAAHFVLANAAWHSGQLDAAFSGGRVLLLKSEQLILTRLFHLLLGPRNPEIQLQDTLLCLPSESVKAALNEKPQSFHESSVCSDKPSDAWLLRRTVKESVQSEVLSPNLPLRHRPNRCNLVFYGESETYNFKVIWTLIVIKYWPFLPCPWSHVSLTHFPPSNPTGSPNNMRHYRDIQEPGQNCPMSNHSPQMEQLWNLININLTFRIFAGSDLIWTLLISLRVNDSCLCAEIKGRA